MRKRTDRLALEIFLQEEKGVILVASRVEVLTLTNRSEFCTLATKVRRLVWPWPFAPTLCEKKAMCMHFCGVLRVVTSKTRTVETGWK